MMRSNRAVLSFIFHWQFTIARCDLRICNLKHTQKFCVVFDSDRQVLEFFANLILLRLENQVMKRNPMILEHHNALRNLNRA